MGSISGPSPAHPRLVAADAGVLDAGSLVRLRTSRCPSCGRLEFPSRRACPGCGSATTESSVGPEAVLTGFTAVLHQPPDASIAAPYAVGVATYDDRLSVLGVVEGASYDDLARGQPLFTVAARVGSELVHAFRLQ